MSDAAKNVENIRGDTRSGHAYIHGSVEESPSGDLVRSLERPGAKTPRPYPRVETHHGSFTVNLDPPIPVGLTHDPQRRNHSPMLYAVSKSFKTNAGITNKVLGDFVLVQPTTISVMEGLREIPMKQCLRHEVSEFNGFTWRSAPLLVYSPRME